MTGCAASRFEYKYNAPPASFQAQLPPFCDRRRRIGRENNASAAQAAFSGQMCPEGHRNAFLGCQVGRRLFLKASKILADLGVIVPEEVPFIEIGECPTIEA
jgi:hypothetical protein